MKQGFFAMASVSLVLVLVPVCLAVGGVPALLVELLTLSGFVTCLFTQSALRRLPPKARGRTRVVQAWVGGLTALSSAWLYEATLKPFWVYSGLVMVALVLTGLLTRRTRWSVPLLLL